jgi:hypothetical protein
MTYAFARAIILNASGEVLPVPDLIREINAVGYTTSYGTPYSGGRGSYRFVKATYDRVWFLYGEEHAEKVAIAFVKPDGDYAYH